MTGFLKIKDVRIGMKKIFLKDCKVIEAKNSEIQKEGKPIPVCNAVIKDDTGIIKLCAWGFNAEGLAKSSSIIVANCYCKEYKGDENFIDKREITSGQFGRIIPTEDLNS